MSGSVSAQYIPLYPVHDGLPDPEIRTFITNFYRISDKQELNELWVDQFTKDAHIAVGPAKATGREDIRTMREGMWSAVQERSHTVRKVFPGQFIESADSKRECELMLHGEVSYKTKDGVSSTVAWAGHGTVRKVQNEDGNEEWKFAAYSVYMLK
ncbi:hypothetical protein ACSS6W_003784 [Trichoderma asperelloides]|nr:hypothetical protein LI328DRAFT_5893 [Trichoderma asperelloides]